MRLAPVAMAHFYDPGEVASKSELSSRTTHGTKTALDACRFFGVLLAGALNGATKDDLLAPDFERASKVFTESPLHPEIMRVVSGSYKTKNPPEIRGTGYVVQSLEAALWAFYNSTSFEEGCLMAVNLGDDADTTGAVYGQFAGAYYGEDSIPIKWREKLAHRIAIELLAEQVYALARRNGAG